MKTAIATIIIASSVQTFAQGTFENLNFEQASPVPVVGSPYYPYAVTTASAVPFWTVYYGNTPQSQILYNTMSLGAPEVDLFGPNNGVGDPGVIDGNYSVGLKSGFGPGFVPQSVSLWQNGTMPANAESLEFDAANFGGGTPLSVSFAGDNLTLFVLSSAVAPSGQPYSVYGANIAPYAGQTGQLEFTATFYNWVELDDISFSTQAIPEPSPLALTGIGGFLFALYRRLSPRRR
ncbi:MAG TPA: PEP-CTERM sorting domain-containing protein [Candidatus Baltobacteraceae bacterium]|jgi:hypothetical protein|nr:PEP-CTERM sorting domain-containing protein [Candidatus Baltobacteraceae bacterium]